MIWFMINFILALNAGFIIYNLALSFTGTFVNVKTSFLPVLIFATLIFISKYLLHATSTVQTILLVILCAIFVYAFNTVDIILSLIGTLLALILEICGSILIVCPLLVKFGFTIAMDMQSIDWFVLNLGETTIPLICLLILRVKKISIINFLSASIK